jgi:hypothetical protein
MAERHAMRLLRYAWAAPATLVGLLFAGIALALGGRGRWVDGVLEVGGGFLGRGASRAPECLRFGAITLGHVILGLDDHNLDACRAHEHVHVRQYERWGVFFFPAYALSGAWQALRGRHWYLDNPFEREARDPRAQARGENPPARSEARR